MAERIRCGGAGLGGFLTPTGIGTVVQDGKQVLNHSIANGNQINVSQLSKGFYLYKIIGNENISAGKLIVE